MKSISIKTALVVVALAGAIFAVRGTASATSVLVEITAPTQVKVGEAVAVQAMLRSADDGLAITNTPVTFYWEGSFAGVNGEVELGRAVTDETGVATLAYRPRSAGEHQVRVEYLVPGDTEPQVATAANSIFVAGAAQLHTSTAGVQIPGLNVWLIIALVTVVWAILFSIGLRIVAIALAGRDEAPPERVLRPEEVGKREAVSAEASTSEA